MCPVCYKLGANPHLVCRNDHILCGVCTYRMERDADELYAQDDSVRTNIPMCPMCKADWTPNRPVTTNRAYGTYWNSIKMECVHCHMTMSAQHAATHAAAFIECLSCHEPVCKFVGVNMHKLLHCPVEHVQCGDCACVFRAIDAPAHKLECAHRPVKMKCCGQIVQYANTDAHMSRCLDFEIECDVCGLIEKRRAFQTGTHTKPPIVAEFHAVVAEAKSRHLRKLAQQHRAATKRRRHSVREMDNPHEDDSDESLELPPKRPKLRHNVSTQSTPCSRYCIRCDFVRCVFMQRVLMDEEQSQDEEEEVDTQ
jgi:hypothetical protein